MKTAATGTDQVFRLENLFETRQMFRQRSAIGGPRFAGLCFKGAFGRPILGILFGVERGDAALDILEREVELVWVQPLGLPPEERLFEGGNQGFKTQVPGFDGKDPRLQGIDIVGQIGSG
jgi:hypothetical protein